LTVEPRFSLVYPKVCPQNRKKERKQVLARVARNFSIPPQPHFQAPDS